MTFRTLAALASALGIAGLLAGTAPAAEAPTSIRIGYAVSLSGPFSPGTMTTTVPNYRLWAKDVNDAGGIYLKKYDKKVPLEVIELDDRSNMEDVVRLVERLMTAEKVDIVRGEHLDRRGVRRFRERVRVHAEVERPRHAPVAPQLRDGRADRHHVLLVERAGARRAAVTGRAERDALQRSQIRQAGISRHR